jgi:hypothetical protein
MSKSDGSAIYLKDILNTIAKCGHDLRDSSYPNYYNVRWVCHDCRIKIYENPELKAVRETERFNINALFLTTII